jgi:hypothetical protein
VKTQLTHDSCDYEHLATQKVCDHHKNFCMKTFVTKVLPRRFSRFDREYFAIETYKFTCAKLQNFCDRPTKILTQKLKFLCENLFFDQNICTKVAQQLFSNLIFAIICRCVALQCNCYHFHFVQQNPPTWATCKTTKRPSRTTMSPVLMANPQMKISPSLKEIYQLWQQVASIPTTNVGGLHSYVGMICNNADNISFSHNTESFSIPTNPGTYLTTVDPTNAIVRAHQEAKNKMKVIEFETYLWVARSLHLKIANTVDPEWLETIKNLPLVSLTSHQKTCLTTSAQVALTLMTTTLPTSS